MDSLDEEIRKLAAKFDSPLDTRTALERVETKLRRRNSLRKASVIAFAFLVSVPAIALLSRSLTGQSDTSGAQGGVRAFGLEMQPGESVGVVTIDPTRDLISDLHEVRTSDVQWIYPDLALSPAGDVAYLAYAASDGTMQFEMLSTSSGEVLAKVQLRDVIGTQLPSDYLSVGLDGKVYVYQSVVVGPGSALHDIAIFDPESQRLLPEGIELGKCGGTEQVYALDATRVGVVCDIPREFRVYSVAEDGSGTLTNTLDLPPVANDGGEVNSASDFIVGGAMEGESLYLVTQAGEVFTIDTKAVALVANDHLDLGSDGYVTYDGFALSDAETVLVTAGPIEDFEAFLASDLLTLDIGEWSLRESQPLSPRTNGDIAVTSPDGALLVDPSTGQVVEVSGASVTTLQATSLLEVETVPV